MATLKALDAFPSHDLGNLTAIGLLKHLGHIRFDKILILVSLNENGDGKDRMNSDRRT